MWIQRRSSGNCRLTDSQSSATGGAAGFSTSRPLEYATPDPSKAIPESRSRRRTSPPCRSLSSSGPKSRPAGSPPSLAATSSPAQTESKASTLAAYQLIDVLIYRPQGWISPALLVDGQVEGVWRHERKTG